MPQETSTAVETGAITATADNINQTEGAETPEVEAAEPKQEQGKKLSFNELLKDPEYQREFDKKIEKAFETRLKKWEQQQGMTAEQLAEQKLEEERQTLAEERAAFAKERFTTNLREELMKQKLPTAFAEVLAEGISEEDAPMVLQAIKQEWDAQIKEAIKAGARQTTPAASQTTTPEGNNPLDLAEFARANRKVK